MYIPSQYEIFKGYPVLLVLISKGTTSSTATGTASASTSLTMTADASMCVHTYVHTHSRVWGSHQENISMPLFKHIYSLVFTCRQELSLCRYLKLQLGKLWGRGARLSVWGRWGSPHPLSPVDWTPTWGALPLTIFPSKIHSLIEPCVSNPFY